MEYDRGPIYSYLLFKGRQGRTPLRFRYLVCLLRPWELRRNGSSRRYYLEIPIPIPGNFRHQSGRGEGICEMNQLEKKPPGPAPTAICHFCGYAIHTHELGGEINGRFVDYEKRVQGTVDCTFCTECWSKIMTFSGEDNDNLKAAIERRRKDFGDV